MRSRLKSVRHIGFNNAKALFCFSSPDIIAFLLSPAAVLDDSEPQTDRANAPKLEWTLREIRCAAAADLSP
jgi:hypothetical protein